MLRDWLSLYCDDTTAVVEPVHGGTRPMNTPHANIPGRRNWVAGMALVSLVLPVATVVAGREGTRLSDYRLTVVALILGIASAAGPLVFNRAATPAWLRWLSVGLAGLGFMVAGYLLFAL